MPYIITTKTARATARTANGSDLERHERSGTTIDTRTAVATLDEAREAIRDDLTATPMDEDLRRELASDVAAIPESGGTVGPLPDGTVIEVRQVEKFELGFAAGLIAADHPQFWDTADLVTKFNAA